MNNLFIEGPIQTGKSTTIRSVLKERFGSDLEGVAGFTSQRVTNLNGQLLAFRLAPAAEDISIVLDIKPEPVFVRDVLNNVFKWFAPDGPHVDMRVFETAGVAYMKNAQTDVKSGRAQIVLLDEIGGHELASDVFRHELYELLDSDIPCVGVIKSRDNTRNMDPTLLAFNEELHNRISAVTGLQLFESRLRQFLENELS